MRVTSATVIKSAVIRAAVIRAIVIRTVVIGLVCVGAATTAFAQESSALGLTVGYPGSVGLLWNVSDRVGIRTSFDAQRTSTADGNNVSQVTVDGWLAGTSVSVLTYLGARDGGFRLYAGPRAGYTRSSESIDGVGIGSSYRSRTNAYSVAGLVGAQYLLGTRFAVFGEAGVQYARLNRRSGIPGIVYFGGNPESITHQVGSTGGIGVTLFF